jgi:hypothetical protein
MKLKALEKAKELSANWELSTEARRLDLKV